MANSAVTLKVKDLFFDRKGIIDKMNRANQRALSRIGSFIRSTARQSLKYRKLETASAPGTPPFVHRVQEQSAAKKAKLKPGRKAQKVSPLRELLFFFYDNNSKSTVVGPVKFGRKSLATVPHLLEFGGTTVNTKFGPPSTRKATPAQSESFKRLVSQGRISVAPRPRVRYVARYPARPWMGPALEKETKSDRIVRQWAGVLQGA